MPEVDHVEADLMCDAPDCRSKARWFVGLSKTAGLSRGHAACGEHLDEGATMTLLQLTAEGWREGLRLYPLVQKGQRVWPL